MSCQSDDNEGEGGGERRAYHVRATSLMAMWHLFSYQNREREGSCWLTWPGTDPGQ